MSLATRLTDLAAAVGADIKSINSKLGTVALDPWHNVGSAGAASFGANWAAYTTCAYRKDPFGKVMLRGVMKSSAAFAFGGANSTLLTLPAGYWPIVDWDFKVIVTEPDGSTTSECQIRIYAANGVVQLIGPVTNTRAGGLQSGGSGTFIRLDEIEFDTGTVSQVLAGPPGPPGGSPSAFVLGTANITTNADGTYKDVPGLSFTATASATYQIRGVFDATVAAGFSVIGYLKVNGVRTGAVVVLQNNNTGSTSFRGDFAQQWQVPLLAGDVVTFEIGGSASAANTMWATHTNMSFSTSGLGPQGPKGDKGDKGDAGGLTGIMKDLDGINSILQTPFRSRLMFKGPNFSVTDGGPADPFGGGDYTAISYSPTQGSGPLPTANVREGQEYDLAIAPGVVWRMRYIAGKWTMVGGAPLTFHQEGENNAYAAFAAGTNITVNAAQTKILGWSITPQIDCWAEVSAFMGIVQKVDLAYHYAQLSLTCSPAPAVGAPSGTVLQTNTKTQHASVQQYEPYEWSKIVGLTGGVSYTFLLSCAISGGTWQFYQGPGMLGFNGKLWPR